MYSSADPDDWFPATREPSVLIEPGRGRKVSRYIVTSAVRQGGLHDDGPEVQLSIIMATLLSELLSER